MRARGLQTLRPRVQPSAWYFAGTRQDARNESEVAVCSSAREASLVAPRGYCYWNPTQLKMLTPSAVLAALPTRGRHLWLLGGSPEMFWACGFPSGTWDPEGHLAGAGGQARDSGEISHASPSFSRRRHTFPERQEVRASALDAARLPPEPSKPGAQASPKDARLSSFSTQLDRLWL